MASLCHIPVSQSLQKANSLIQRPQEKQRTKQMRQAHKCHTSRHLFSHVRSQNHGSQRQGPTQRLQVQIQTQSQISFHYSGLHSGRGIQTDGSSWSCRREATTGGRIQMGSHKWSMGMRTRAAVAEAAPASATTTPFLQVEGVGFKPPGSPTWLLKDVSLSLPHSSLGLIYGRSGSGKTTLLQVLSGLSSATCGTISMAEEAGAEEVDQLRRFQMRSLSRKEVAQKAGIVFQFPERYFLTDSLMTELTFGWPRRLEDMPIRLKLASRVQAALAAVGLLGVPLDTNPRALSGGNQRRLALAIQLVRLPELLLLDEPLAGLDWSAREDVVGLLRDLKKHCAVLVVSHDLRELTPLVDKSWHMRVGGDLQEEPLPSSLLVSDDEE